jgi:NAD-dependent dihydropyrimidine dehydrogenase PreA subunit
MSWVFFPSPFGSLSVFSEIECGVGQIRREKVITKKVTQDVCFGCGACVASCPPSALQLAINERGFLVPVVSGECQSCGICEVVCPALSLPEAKAEKVEVFAAFSLTKNLRVWSTSGGVATSLALVFARKGMVAGVVFDDGFRLARHTLTSDPRKILQFAGSKYIQSNPVSAIWKMKGSEGPFIFFGTPCQVAGVRNLIEKGVLKGDFLLVDLFCHGVPSYLLWWSYLDFLKKRVGRILHIEQRFKIQDWHRFYHRIFGNKGVYLKEFSEDPFGFFYLRNYFLRECCYRCPFRGLHSFADLRLGDFWGQLFAQDKFGTSLVVAFTEKGLSHLVEDEDIFLQSMPVEMVKIPQAKDIPKPRGRENLFLKLQQGISLENIFSGQLRWEWRKVKLRKPLSFLLRNRYVRIAYKLTRLVFKGKP